MRALFLCSMALAVACGEQAEPGQEAEEAASDDDDDDDDDEKPEDAGQRRRDASQAGGDAGSARARDAGASGRSEADSGSSRARRDGGVPSMPGPANDAGARPDAAPSGGPTGNGSVGDDELEMLRQLCVDEVNMYRSTLGVAPLTRVPEQEECSDQGAQSDADTGRAHGSAGKCAGLGGQDTCPGWGVGGFSGNATVAAALTKCLAQMWAEGEPPVSRQECERDYQGCFLKYGHYLNMSDTRYKKIACGFYKMPNGSWWMNQNFGF